jgi:hypothetical protein
MAPNVNLPRYASMNGSLYWCAKDGIAKVAADEDTTGTLSGMSRAPDIVGITTSTGTVLPNNASVAYRVLWGVVDANDNLVRGPPSGRATYYNTSGSATNPVLTLRPPAFVIRDSNHTYFWQVYRTAVSAVGTTLADIVDPGDDMQLIAQGLLANLTAGSNSEYTYTDNVSDGFVKGEDLYTNSGQGGYGMANYRPPNAYDIAKYRSSMFYADCFTPSTLTFNLLGIPTVYTITNITNPSGNNLVFTLSGSPGLGDLGTLYNKIKVSVKSNTGVNVNGDMVVTSNTSTTITATAPGAPTHRRSVRNAHGVRGDHQDHQRADRQGHLCFVHDRDRLYHWRELLHVQGDRYRNSGAEHRLHYGQSRQGGQQKFWHLRHSWTTVRSWRHPDLSGGVFCRNRPDVSARPVHDGKASSPQASPAGWETKSGLPSCRPRPATPRFTRRAEP